MRDTLDQINDEEANIQCEKDEEIQRKAVDVKTQTVINRESEAGVTTNTPRRGTKVRERTPRVHIKAENGL